MLAALSLTGGYQCRRCWRQDATSRSISRLSGPLQRSRSSCRSCATARSRVSARARHRQCRAAAPMKGTSTGSKRSSMPGTSAADVRPCPGDAGSDCSSIRCRLNHQGAVRASQVRASQGRASQNGGHPVVRVPGTTCRTSRCRTATSFSPSCISSSSAPGLPGVADWLKANGDAVKAFLDWSAKYQWPSMQTAPIR